MTQGAPSASVGGFVGAFIQRPVLASVVSLLIIIAGLAALSAVEVRELPEVDQPVVSIRTDYPGATPDAIDAEVTAIIESAVAQVDGVQSISSSSSYGRSSVTVDFLPSADIDVAATDIKNAVSAIGRELPEDIEEPIVRKADSDASPIMRIYIEAPGYDPGDLARLVDDVVLPRLQAVDGVAQADDYGVRNRVIRIRINAVALAARNFTVDDVATLVEGAVRNTPSGRLRNDAQQLLIRAEALSETPEDIASLRLDSRTRLADVAIVEWGFEDETTTARVNGEPGIGIGIIRQAQSNTVAVSQAVHEAIAELNRSLPQNVDLQVAVDDSVFISAAIREVFKSLLLATSIVVIVIFLFLRSVRATLIPAVTIPVSLLGTIAALWLAGFSINLITLLALVMATGLVVDDAIVVTENIQRWRAKGAGKRAAAILGTREIVFAVLATTATLASVFIPISFLPGQAGRLFSEFGFVLAFAVMISSFVALTLCPVLTVRLGRARRPEMDEDANLPSHQRKPGGPVAAAYAAILKRLLARPSLAIVGSLIFAIGAIFTFQAIPKELTPTEDRGRVFLMLFGQEGSNFEYLDRKVLEIENRLQPIVDEGRATATNSISGIRGGQLSFVFLRLPDWSERSETQQDFERETRRRIADIPGITAIIRSGNSLGIRGAGQGLRFAVVGDDYDVAADSAELLAARLEESDTFTDVRADYQTSQPQITIDIDREAANAFNIPIPDITRTVQVMADEFKASQIFVGDDIIDLLISSAGEPVNDPTDLSNIFLRAQNGDFVPLSSVASVREVAVASELAREQRRRAVPVSAGLREGVALGDAVEEMRAAADDILDGTLSITLLGEAKVLQDSSAATLAVFAVAALIVLLVLAAQFESFVSAVIIMVTVPFGLASAVYAVQLTGGSMNYYSQIGLILLIGIMAKNGILLVEFANQQRDNGLSVRDSIERAAMTRLRPILMTALSTLLASLPLILSGGAGAEARASLGWVIFGGLGFATVFTLFLTPVAFLALARFSKPRVSEGEKVAEELANAPVNS
ncbi:MAG: efflux RND transporter permease subunit [Pseudomonadota bacterium]